MINEVPVLVPRGNEDYEVPGNLNVKGKVGIGITNPQAKLTVCGDPSTLGIETAEIMRLYRIGVLGVKNNNSASLCLGSFEEGPGGRARLDFNLSGTPFDGNTYGIIPDVTVMSLLGNGNVGIGTSEPSQLLTLGSGNILLPNANLEAEGNLFFGGITANCQNGMRLFGLQAGFIDVRTSNPLDGLRIRIDTNNASTERLRITAEGNVGIGTSNPKYKLDVNGTINASEDIVIGGGDCAEEFDIIDAKSIEPGTVMVIDNNGALRASEKPYDKRVAGVISGAGDLRPGITLDKQTNKASRLPVALNGKVYCKVDADCAAVEVGDLLTTSSRYGYAMKVDDHVRSIGAIIGKALKPLETGCGLIPILVALQ